MRNTWMIGIASARAAALLAMTALVLLLAACGPGNVVPLDDDDAVAGDDDTVAGDDDTDLGTGTISVSYTLLAVLPEGQTVEPEIVISIAPFSDYVEEVEIDGTSLSFGEASDGFATGRSPPADIVVTAGQRYIVELKINEPNDLVAQRFVAAPHEVAVERDGTAECGMFVGRDLSGMWRTVEECGTEPWSDEPFEIRTEFREQITPESSPCPSATWATGWEAYGNALCLLGDDRVWWEWQDPTYPFLIDGTILDNGARMEYTLMMWEDGCPAGSYTFERVE